MARQRLTKAERKQVAPNTNKAVYVTKKPKWVKGHKWSERVRNN